MEERKNDITLKELYTQLITRLKNIIIKPSREWKIIQREDNDINEILTNYSLPLIGLCTIASFLSVLINLQEINYQTALKHALITFTALFGGLYLSYIATNHLLSLFHISTSKTINFKIVAYASTPLMIITFLATLFPELIFLYLALLYSYYIISRGIKHIISVNSSSILYISIIITFIIHFLPFFVQRLLLKMLFI